MANQELIEDFVKSIVEADNALFEKNDHELHNELFNRTVRITRNILSKEGALNALMPLLSHDLPSVRSRAATFLLAERPELAASVLTECSKEDSITGLEAKTLLRELEEGRYNPKWWQA